MTDKTVSIDIRKDLFGANEAAASINAYNGVRGYR